MADLTVTNIIEAGVLVTTANANSGGNDTAANKNGDVLLYATNPGASSATVIVTAQNTSKDLKGFGTLTRANLSVVVNAGETKLIGPIPNAFNDTDGNIVITYSGAGAADIDIAAFRMPEVG